MKTRSIVLILSMVAFMVAILFPRLSQALESCEKTADRQVNTVKVFPDGRTIVEIGLNAGVHQVIRHYGANYERATGKPLTWQVIHAANPNKVFPACGSRYIGLGNTSVWDACPEDKRTIGLMACKSGHIMIPITTPETHEEKEARHLALESKDKSVEWHQQRIVELGGKAVTPAPQPAVAPTPKVEDVPKAAPASVPVAPSPLAETQQDARTHFSLAHVVGMAFLAFVVGVGSHKLAVGRQTSSTALVVREVQKDTQRRLPRPARVPADLGGIVNDPDQVDRYDSVIRAKVEEATVSLTNEVRRLSNELARVRRERDTLKLTSGQTINVNGPSQIVVNQPGDPWARLTLEDRTRIDQLAGMMAAQVMVPSQRIRLSQELDQIIDRNRSAAPLPLRPDSRTPTLRSTPPPPRDAPDSASDRQTVPESIPGLQKEAQNLRETLEEERATHAVAIAEAKRHREEARLELEERTRQLENIRQELAEARAEIEQVSAEQAVVEEQSRQFDQSTLKAEIERDKSYKRLTEVVIPAFEQRETAILKELGELRASTVPKAEYDTVAQKLDLTETILASRTAERDGLISGQYPDSIKEMLEGVKIIAQLRAENELRLATTGVVPDSSEDEVLVRPSHDALRPPGAPSFDEEETQVLPGTIPATDDADLPAVASRPKGRNGSNGAAIISPAAAEPRADLTAAMRVLRSAALDSKPLEITAEMDASLRTFMNSPAVCHASLLAGKDSVIVEALLKPLDNLDRPVPVTVLYLMTALNGYNIPTMRLSINAPPISGA